MEKLKRIKELIGLDISDDIIISSLFDVSRKYDNLFVKELKKIKGEKNIVFDSITRNKLRKNYYYGQDNKYWLKFKYTETQLEDVLNDFCQRLDIYNKDTIITSLKKRIWSFSSDILNNKNWEWLQYYNHKRRKWKYSLLVFNINQKLFEEHGYNIDLFCKMIFSIYDEIENYRYLSLCIDWDIYNKSWHCITWKLIYQLSIFMEHCKQFSGKFFPFQREKQISKLTKFLQSRGFKKSIELASDFYKTMSYWFKFEDCFISEHQKTKFLVFRKIELDEKNIPCPSCLTTIQRGNSYPEPFLRSRECQNPECPDRSKSWRGKRFDEYWVYRYFKLYENNKLNVIDDKMYKNRRRDIFSENIHHLDYIIKSYSRDNENVWLFNFREEWEIFWRKIIKINEVSIKNDAIWYENLPIYQLFKKIWTQLKNQSNHKKLKLENKLEIIHWNSTEFLKNLCPNQIGSAITSPPYYNAREYSQWENLIMYLIDMMLNAISVHYSLKQNSYYLYNIGDIVSEDNIYVNSNMSKHRIQLWSLSCMFFELVWFNLAGNIIWDKWEVHSKRNSTLNLFSGYIKPINCYEHIYVFKKWELGKLENKRTVKTIKITPVIKINSKWENTYKHTAPYPLELVNEIQSFSNINDYILDPFLWSWTTLIRCKNNNFKWIWVELNDEYYKLCKEKILGQKYH